MMEERHVIRKRINVRSVERAGYIIAHEYYSPESPMMQQLFIMEKEMTRRFGNDPFPHYRHIELFPEKLVAVSITSGKTWVRGFILERKTVRTTDVFLKIHLIDYCYQELISLEDVRPLPGEFDTSVLECQGMKIVLYGVEPAFVKIDLVDDNKLSGSMQFYEKDKKFILEQCENAESIYFEEICRVEEFYFGNVLLKQSDGSLLGLRELLLQTDNAIECSDFESKIPDYIENFRRNTFAFDYKLSVRKMLFPSISFSDVEQATSARNHCDYNDCDRSHHADVESSLSRRSSSPDLRESANLSNSQTTFSILSSSVEEQSLHERNDLIDKVLVVSGNSTNRIKAVSSFVGSSLDSETLDMLKRLQIRDMSRCQKYLIPAVLSGQNVTVIDGPEAGKTAGVLISLVSLMRKSSKEKQKGLGARAVVVCPYSAKCERVYKDCLRFIQGRLNVTDVSFDPISVNVAYGLGVELEKKNLIDLLKGYDILVCTPKRLLRLLDNEVAFDFKRLSHIVFDDMDTLINSFDAEITQILTHVRRKSKPPQRIFISNQWIPVLKPFIKEDVEHQRGFLLIPSYLDAALFVRLKSIWRCISDERNKLDIIIEMLNRETEFRNIVVTFSNKDNIDSIHEAVQNSCARQIYKIRDFKNMNDSDTVKDWQNDVDRKRCPVLFCTDYVLRDLHVYEADCVIHYSLPEHKMEFLFRFSVLLDRLQSLADKIIHPNGRQIHPCKRPEMYIFSNMKNVKEFPAIMKIMQQLGAEIPDNLKDSAKDVFRTNEMLKKRSVLCPNLKEFGRCFEESRCKFRHIVLQDDSPDENLPSNGYVKAFVTRVFSATHFSVRILERAVEPTGPWLRVEQLYSSGSLSLKLKNHFSLEQNVKTRVRNKIGDIVAFKKNGEFHRVQIIELPQADISQEDDESQVAKRAFVKFIDDGLLEEIPTQNLIELPTSLASIPPAIVEIFICNLLPIDNDVGWSDQITDIVRDKIMSFQKYENYFFTGKVEFVLGRNLWLDSFKCERVERNVKDPITIFSVSKMLCQQQSAIHNEQHLLSLLQMREDAGFEKIRSTANFRHYQGNALGSDVNDANKVPSKNDSVFLKPTPVESKSKNNASSLIVENSLKPQVEWRQDSVHVILNVAVNSDPDKFKVEPIKQGRKTRLHFRAWMDQKFYEFDEVLFSNIQKFSVESYKSGVFICIKMTKLLTGIKWKQLFRTNAPCKWVRIDKNVIDSSDDDSDLEENQSQNFRDIAEYDMCSNSDASEDDVSDSCVNGCYSDN